VPRSLAVVWEKLNDASARFEKNTRLLLLECLENAQLASLDLSGRLREANRSEQQQEDDRDL